MEPEVVSHRIAPVFDARSRVLVLGTMPSPASRARGFYYGHPQNRFWKVLGALFDEPEPLGTDTRKAFLLAHGIAFFDPFARWIGLDGTLFMAFLLGFPANEIVLPIALMGYLAEGALVEAGDALQLRALLLANGWTLETAVCTLLFSLMHWPCSTTCLTIYRETRSWKWTLLAMALPTAMGLSACALAARIL